MKPDKVIRSKHRKKTIAIEVTEEGEVVLRVPLNTKDVEIERIILKNKDWIKKKRVEILSKAKITRKEFKEGEKFLFLGREYPLKAIKPQDKPLKFSREGFVLSDRHLEVAKEIFVKWYKDKAKRIISERVKFYAKRCSLPYDRVRITSANKRWGSCSKRGNLNFSYRLIMAPLSVIDYVVVHELCHIKERNHSRNFWKLVESIMPDYKTYKDYLKNNGYLLRI